MVLSLRVVDLEVGKINVLYEVIWIYVHPDFKLLSQTERNSINDYFFFKFRNFLWEVIVITHPTL